MLQHNVVDDGSLKADYEAEPRRTPPMKKRPHDWDDIIPGGVAQLNALQTAQESPPACH